MSVRFGHRLRYDPRMRRAVALRYGAIQFVVLVTIAMAFYPGGNYADAHAPHYRLSMNFLSDLGATRAWSGTTNYVACALFFTALTTIGATLIVWSWRRFACYAASLTLVMAANRAQRRHDAVNATYLIVVLGYVALVVFGPRLDSESGFRTQVIGQKLVVLASMLHITWLTTQVVRAAALS